MAPEQLTGETVDYRADVSAAGLILFEMLSGRPPFRGKTVGLLLTSIVTEAPDLEPLVARGVPPDVIAIISRAIQKDPQQRWPSALVMANALRVGLYGESILSRHTPTPTRSAAVRTTIVDETVHGSETASEEQGPLRGLLSINSATSAQNGTSNTMIAAGVIAVLVIGALAFFSRAR